MATPGSEYTDITDPDEIPSHNWALCWVGADNDPVIVTPIDWSSMTDRGYVHIMLTAEQTLEHAGERLHLEVRNDGDITDLLTLPEDVFYFVPNDMHNIQNS